MDALRSYLPRHAGNLPLFLLFISVVSIANSAQSYITVYYSQRIYCGPKPAPSALREVKAYNGGEDLSNSFATPLSSRTFGTWTFLAGIVRAYAAYNIENRAIYQMTLWTFVIAGGHFFSEWLFFKTTRWSAPLASTTITASVGLIWMATQYDYYVK